MVTHYNVYCTPHFSGGYHGDPAHAQAVCARPSPLVTIWEQGHSLIRTYFGPKGALIRDVLV